MAKSKKETMKREERQVEMIYLSTDDGDISIGFLPEELALLMASKECPICPHLEIFEDWAGGGGLCLIEDCPCKRS